MGESAKCPCGMPSFLKQDTQHSTLLNRTHSPPLALTDPASQVAEECSRLAEFQVGISKFGLETSVSWTVRQSAGGAEPQNDSLFHSGKKAKVAK